MPGKQISTTERAKEKNIAKSEKNRSLWYYIGLRKCYTEAKPSFVKRHRIPPVFGKTETALTIERGKDVKTNMKTYELIETRI